MDTDQVRMMASALRREADTIDGLMASIRASVKGANWQSQAREEYVSNLETLLRVNAQTTQAMRLMAQAAEKKAEQWEKLASKFNGPFEFIGDIWRNFLDHLNNTWQGIVDVIAKITIPAFTFIPIVSGQVGDWFESINFPWEDGAWPPSWAPWLKPEGTAPNTQAPKQQTPDTNGEVGEGVKVEPAPVAPSKPVEPVALRQGDYKGVKMNNKDDDPETIASAGCLITSAAIIGRQFGANVTPVDVDAFLDNHPGGYQEGSSNLGSYKFIEKFYEDQMPGRDFGYKVVSNSNIANEFNNGSKIIIHVKTYKNGNETVDGHWVVVDNIDEEGNFITIDPATGRNAIYSPSDLHKKNNSVAFFENK
jgi:hypothetical protein